MRALKLTLIMVLLPALCASYAAGKSNFTGDWKMNTAKSEFGGMPAPSRFEQKIAHNEPELKISMSFAGEFGEFSADSVYTTDGKECVNTSAMGESKSTVNWEGDTLVIVTKMDMQGTEVTITNRYTLSEDGKTITVKGHFSSPQGEGDSTVTMEKAETK
ncbi:MAG: hypothetical protein EHM23_25775 [Acidobacteria bacterium]|nr:MAG: hypothetical protein EHM23_25775 [Acidobacteriota bacterium]